MQINLKYKIDGKDSQTTLGIISSMGYAVAMELAYSKAIKIVEREPESILSVTLLAWSHNLLTDSREVKTENEGRDLRFLASFYRNLAHKVYFYQRENDKIGVLSDFIQQVR